jgi:MFS family permease
LGRTNCFDPGKIAYLPADGIGSIIREQAFLCWRRVGRKGGSFVRMVSRGRIVYFCVLTLLFWFADYAFAAYLSTYAARMTSSVALVGVMLGSYGWAQILLRVPIGILSDKMNNRRLFIQIGCIVNCLSAFGLWLSPNIFWLIVCRALNGVAVSTWVTITVLFGSYYTPDESVRALSIINACNFGGSLLASVGGVVVSGMWDIRATFLLAGVVGVVPMVMSFGLKEKNLDKTPLRFSELFAVGKTKWVMAVSCIGVLCQLMSYATALGFTPQLVLRLGADESAVGYVLLVFMAGGVLSSFFAGRLFIRPFGARNSLVALMALQAVTTILQPLAQSQAVLWVLVFFSGVARGTSMSLMLGLVIKPFPYRKQAAAMGFFQSVYSVGIFLGPMIAGALVQGMGLDAAFYICGALGLIAPLLGKKLLQDERSMTLRYD